MNELSCAIRWRADVPQSPMDSQTAQRPLTLRPSGGIAGTGMISGLQSFADVQASGFARHPGRSYRNGSVDPLGSRGFYVRAYDGLLPPRPSDMLAVRIGQLTAWGLTPHKTRGLAGRSSNEHPVWRSNGQEAKRGWMGGQCIPWHGEAMGSFFLPCAPPGCP